MRKDTQEELERLESWLLAEEEEAQTQEEEWDEDEPAPMRNYASGYKIYNSDHTDEDLDTFSEAVREPKKDSMVGLYLLIILLCMGILCVLAWWLLRWKGVIG